MVDNKSLTGALVKMGLDREAAEENACRIRTRYHGRGV